MQEYAVRGGGGRALKRLQKPCQTALRILPRLNVPSGTVVDADVVALADCVSGVRRVLKRVAKVKRMRVQVQ